MAAVLKRPGKLTTWNEDYKIAIASLRSSDEVVWTSGASLGRRALEKYLKQALILAGKRASAGKKIRLVNLVRQLAKTDTRVRPSDLLPQVGPVPWPEPITIEAALKRFDVLHRARQRSGPDDALVLDALFRKFQQLRIA